MEMSPVLYYDITENTVLTGVWNDKDIIDSFRRKRKKTHSDLNLYDIKPTAKSSNLEYKNNVNLLHLWLHLLHLVRAEEFDFTGLDEWTGLFLSRNHDRHRATEWHRSDEYRGRTWCLRLSSISPERAAVLWLKVVLGMSMYLADIVTRQPMERIGPTWVQMCATWSSENGVTASRRVGVVVVGHSGRVLRSRTVGYRGQRAILGDDVWCSSALTPRNPLWSLSILPANTSWFLSVYIFISLQKMPKGVECLFSRGERACHLWKND